MSMDMLLFAVCFGVPLLPAVILYAMAVDKFLEGLR